MTDKDDILIADFFKQAAQQQIADNGFTERVMRSLPDRQVEQVRRLSRLWTWFCILLGTGLFFALGGMQILKMAAMGVARMILTTIEVFVVTAPTAEIPVNPWVILLLLAFVLVYLPYQTGRKLSSVL